MAKQTRRVRVAEKSPLSFPRLDELTRNPETSARLVEHARARNPDRSLKWCMEKAIYDIERDRMA